MQRHEKPSIAELIDVMTKSLSSALSVAPVAIVRDRESVDQNEVCSPM